MPPGATEAGVAAASRQLQKKYGTPLPEALSRFLRESDGPALFDGSLTFFSATPRSARNKLSRRSETPFDLFKAIRFYESIDFPIRRAHDRIVFAAQLGHGPYLWAVGPTGCVQELNSSYEVIGPDLPFEVWLADLVADLEWLWEHPAAYESSRYHWLLGDTSPSDSDGS